MARSTKIIKTVEGNTAPPLTLTAQEGGVAINLTGCTVDLIITQKGVQTNSGHTACTVTDVINGIVTYVRQAGDIPTKGNYNCDLQVTYGDGTKQILFTQLILQVEKKSNSTT